MLREELYIPYMLLDDFTKELCDRALLNACNGGCNLRDGLPGFVDRSILVCRLVNRSFGRNPLCPQLRQNLVLCKITRCLSDNLLLFGETKIHCTSPSYSTDLTCLL